MLGETFHSTGLGTTAKAQDDRHADVYVPPYINLLYPLFPDAAYEIESLFGSPRFIFPGIFIHSMVSMRKTVVNGLVPFLATPQPAAATQKPNEKLPAAAAATPTPKAPLPSTAAVAKEEKMSGNAKQTTSRAAPKASRKLRESMKLRKMATANKVVIEA